MVSEHLLRYLIGLGLPNNHFIKIVAMKTGSYEAPALWIQELDSENLLCASTGKWYEQGGLGDFTYGYETDDTWS